MKGITRMIPRVPQQMKQMINKNQDEIDLEFKMLEDKVENINTHTKNLITDSEKFKKNVENMIKRQEDLGTTMLDLHKPIITDSPLSSTEDISMQRRNSFRDMNSSNGNTRNIELYLEKTRLMREQISTHLDGINEHIIIPIKKYSEAVQSIKRVIKKRSHKFLDYERHKQNLDKLNEKQNKSLDDERKVAKTTESFTISEGEFRMYDEQLRSQLPMFFNYSTQLFDSCLINFYNTQKDVYHIMYVYFYELASECGLNLTTDLVQQYESMGCASLLDQIKMDELKTFITSSSTLNKRNSFSQSANPAATTTSTGRQNSEYSDELPPYASESGSFTSNPPPYRNNTVGDGNSQYASGSGGYPTKSYTTSPSYQSTKPPIPPLPVQPANNNFVTALYDFTAQGPSDISFKRGDRIEIISRTPNNNEWWTGKINGRIGQFPGNYVE